LVYARVRVRACAIGCPEPRTGGMTAVIAAVASVSGAAADYQVLELFLQHGDRVHA
jgi:hypothetical protein